MLAVLFAVLDHKAFVISLRTFEKSARGLLSWLMFVIV